MAELRKIEEELSSMVETYHELQRDEKLKDLALPVLVHSNLSKALDMNDTQNVSSTTQEEAHTDSEATTTTRQSTKQEEQEAPVITATSSSSSLFPSFAVIWQHLEGIEARLVELQPRMAKLEQRLTATDPVTLQPRYGENTRTRVTTLLACYQELRGIFDAWFLEKDKNDTLVSPRPPNTSHPVVAHILAQVQQEQEQAAHEAREQARLEQERRDELERQERARQQAEADAVRAAQQEQERLEHERRAQQEALRDAERQERLEAERADRAWVSSIAKGPEGVRAQLQILLANTFGVEQQTALAALVQMFQQICARPEEVKFRRIRRDHEQFERDIGRHAGGKELLIAAGFELGHVEGVPSFLSKEPDLETDMDKWSAWFDLLKATLAILQEQVKKR